MPKELDLDAIEGFWVARVLEFFAAEPFRIRLDGSRSLRLVVRDVLEQVEERQKAALGGCGRCANLFRVGTARDNAPHHVYLRPAVPRRLSRLTLLASPTAN
jgi:hypothetical protein